ncbi:MAG: PepSY-associated TM helix domain-containing protein [Calditrichia bacterium]
MTISTKVRKIIRALHRDIGYLSTFLIIIYSISGIAVNHVHEWNPNYQITRGTYHLGDFRFNWSAPDSSIREILGRIRQPVNFKSYFRPDPKTVNIFVESNTISYNLQTNTVTAEIVRPRPLIYPMNFLHLNHAKKLWTWIADLFAVALIFLAVSGLVILKGKNGIAGRGAWLSAIGVLIPLLFWLLYL